MNLRPLPSNKRYNIPLFYLLIFSYFVHFQYFNFKNTATPPFTVSSSFPCAYQIIDITLQG